MCFAGFPYGRGWGVGFPGCRGPGIVSVFRLDRFMGCRSMMVLFYVVQHRPASGGGYAAPVAVSRWWLVVPPSDYDAWQFGSHAPHWTGVFPLCERCTPSFRPKNAGMPRPLMTSTSPCPRKFLVTGPLRTRPLSGALHWPWNHHPVSCHGFHHPSCHGFHHPRCWRRAPTPLK